MPSDKRSDFGFINSILVLLVSIGITIILLWIVSRILGQLWFEHLPDWLRSAAAKILTTLFSGGSLATIVYKKLSSKGSPNFLLPICATTLGLFIVIVVLVHIFRPHQEQAVEMKAAVQSVPAPPPPPKKTLHTEDEQGHQYTAYSKASGDCKQAIQDDTHSCVFTRTQKKIGESNDYYDHWELRFKPPGPPYEVNCQCGGHELHEDYTPCDHDRPGNPEGDWAICSGWINGSADTINMTVRYQMLW